MKEHELLGTAPVGKLLMKYSIPAIIGMVINSLYNVVDRIFIGNIPNVGPLAISGLGVTMPITIIMLAFGLLIGVGATTNVSIVLGKKDRETAEKLIGNAAILSIIVSIFIMVVGFAFTENILRAFGASDKTLPYAKEYIDIIFCGTIFYVLSFSLNHTIRADGKPVFSAAILVIGCVCNATLDYILMFIFDFGIAGAAYATITAQLLTTVLTLGYYLSGKSNLKFRFRDLKPDWKLTKMIFSIGVSPFIMQVAASATQVIANHSLKAYGGDLAIGSMTVIMSISMLLYMPVIGINQGSQPIIGYNYGANNGERTVKTFYTSLFAATIILIIGFMLTRIFPKQLISLFSNDKDMMALAVDGLRKNFISVPIAGVTILGSNFVQSIGKAKISIFLNMLRQVILIIPFLIILPAFWGLDGVWYAQPIADFTAAVVTALILRGQFKVLKDMSRDKVEI